MIKLILRNVFRHRLRASLTILGVAVAMLAFGILTTLVAAWYVGVETSSANRLVTRNKISLIYMLPLAYRNKIVQVQGVDGIGHGLWYGGIYKDKKNFFAQFAISGMDYLNLFPEFLLSEAEKKAFETHKNAAIAGRRLVQRFGWKIGDVIALQGTIFPGTVEVVLEGIYEGVRRNVDETAFFFRYDYLNEQLRKTFPDRADKAGWYMVRIKDGDKAAEISRDIDALFQSSLAETLTETEKAFQQGFVAMTEAIVSAIKVISGVVIAIILIVLGNTMAMTARERSAEYAVFKTLGFGSGFLFLIIAGESTALALIGGITGAIITIPAAAFFQFQLKSLLPVFVFDKTTLGLIVLISFGLGIVAALPPVYRVSRMGISEGLRYLG
ncbi:MAG: putative transport system permease protein [Thermodesulfobacteriota bacterium]|nr:putative transport system permease protein [Thermodesulfobacteriota bacterium]